jgi:hypothetical protein
VPAEPRASWLLAPAVLVTVAVLIYVVARAWNSGAEQPVPARSTIYFGIYSPGAIPGHYDTRRVQALEAAIGRHFAIDQHYYEWTDPFPTQLEQADLTAGRIPLITWKPTGVSLQAVAGGRDDALLRARGRALAAYGHPVLLRFAHEPNGDWYTWSEDYDQGAPIKGNTAATYVRAWRHIHQVFAEAGARNVSWVWSLNFRDYPAANRAERYYPGDDVVDWIGIDAYNEGDSVPGSSWTAIGPLIAPLYKMYASRKPIMLSEVGSVAKGGDESRWIESLAADLPHDYPAVKAVVWFDRGAFTVDSPLSVLGAFARLGRNQAFSASPSG